MGTAWNGRRTESEWFTEGWPSAGPGKRPVTRILSAFICVHLRFPLQAAEAELDLHLFQPVRQLTLPTSAKSQLPIIP